MDKLKIGVITLALSNNYGAILQTYATGCVLKKLNTLPEIFNYNDKRRLHYKMNAFKILKNNIWKAFVLIITQGRKERRFNNFRKDYIPLTKPYKSNDELRRSNEKYDVYISGSDQIWNPDLYLFDFSYLLDFVPVKKKKISYGSSFGKSSLGNYDVSKMKKLLNQYSFISVREKSGVQIVRNVCGKRAEIVLDPTLLLYTEWFQLANRASEKAKKFHGILCYVMPGDSIVENAIESLAQQLALKTGLPIMRLGIKEYQYFKYGPSGCDITAGPCDFLQYFINAAYIVTNSFHGTIFSLNFSKKFFVPVNYELAKENALHERILSVVEMLQAEGVLISANNPLLPKQWEVDNQLVQRNIEKMRNDSIDYLKRALRLERL